MTSLQLDEALNPETSEERLSKLAFDSSDLVRKAVASHPHTSLTSLSYLAEKFPDEVARNRSFASQVANDPDAFQKWPEQAAMALACLAEAPAWLLEALSKSRCRTVGTVVAARPMLTPAMRSKLRSLSGGDVYLFFLQDPACPEELFLRILNLGDDAQHRPWLPMACLLHRHVARMEHVPAAALDYLRTLPDDNVREALARRGLKPSPAPKQFTLRHATATDVGHMRQYNEDKLGAWEGDTRAVFVVADGMGGGSSGDVAAEIAVATMLQWAREEQRYAPEDLLHHAFVSAYHDVVTKQRARHVMGAGTTLVAALIEGYTAHIANNGDSRAYLVREGVLTLLTDDHSLLNDYLKVVPMTPQEIADFPYKNVITRCLGYDPIHAVPDLFVLTLQPGDRLLLCTDGLYKVLTDSDLARIVGEGEQVEAIAKGLLEAALQTQADDNMALVVVEVGSR